MLLKLLITKSNYMNFERVLMSIDLSKKSKLLRLKCTEINSKSNVKSNGGFSRYNYLLLLGIVKSKTCTNIHNSIYR